MPQNAHRIASPVPNSATGCGGQPQGDLFANAQFDADGAYSGLVVLLRAALPFFFGARHGGLKSAVVPGAALGLRLRFLRLGHRQRPPSGEDEPHSHHGPPFLDRLPFVPQGRKSRNVLVGFFEDSAFKLCKILFNRFRNI